MTRMKVIRKKITETKDGTKSVNLIQIIYQSHLHAAEYLHKLYKIDKGMYRTYVKKHFSEISNCDDGYEYGVSYYFTVDNVTKVIVPSGSDATTIIPLVTKRESGSFIFIIGVPN